jgi:hypothetical protein
MTNSINMGWWVLSKYYHKSEEAPVYTTALLLHPSKRQKYINTHWEPEWCTEGINGARHLWQNYKDRPLGTSNTISTDAKAYIQNAYDLLAQSLDVTDADDNDDEFDRFIVAAPCRISCPPLEWWCREEQRVEYPLLHQMAIDILSIAPMSDEPERVFSGCRRTISWDRARLGVGNIEKTECLGNWNKNDLIRQIYVMVDDDIVDVSGSDGELHTHSTS